MSPARLCCLFALLAAGCGGPGDSALGGADSAGACADAPRVTWDGFADGFFGGYCRPCHSVDAAYRYGAPEALNFDTEAEVMTLAASVRRVVIEEGTMPRGGGVLEDDAALLAVWLDCAAGAR